MDLVRDWLNAWNQKDIERLLKHYHDNVQFSSPTVTSRWNIESGKLEGKEALRKHFLKGFEEANHVEFKFLNVFYGVSGIVLVYRRGAAGMGADLITLDELGKVTRVDVFHSKEA
jgi:ketosteroid isomerase-like protein